ncbi:MAG: hypothetical protein ACK6A9_17620 [Dolichospermum sp.]
MSRIQGFTELKGKITHQLPITHYQPQPDNQQIELLVTLVLIFII